jgi:flagellar motor switch protein FliG
MTTSGAQRNSGLPVPMRTACESNGNTKLSLTPPQKAALVIAALGPSAAGPIIERISDDHLRAFTRAYARLQSVPKAALQGVVVEFVSQLSTVKDEINGGIENTRELLGQFFDEDGIARLMDGLDEPGGENVWKKLEQAGDEDFAEYLSSQKPQLVAVVLSKLGSEQASRILDQFETDIAGKVILCLSKPIDVKESTLQILSDTIERDFLSPANTSAGKSHDPGDMIGAMMNNIMSDKREELLEFISKSAPEILQSVKKSMLTFSDIATRVPPNAIPMAIKEVELDDLLQAVKYGKENAPAASEFILGNISQRMAAQYQEQMEELKPITPKEAEAAQSSFMAVIRGFAASGEIDLIEPMSEEEQAEAAAALEPGAASES